jgi:hypothetical protein
LLSQSRDRQGARSAGRAPQGGQHTKAGGTEYVFEIECLYRLRQCRCRRARVLGSWPTALAIRHSGESVVATAVRDALGPFNAADGRVTLPGWYRVVLARGQSANPWLLPRCAGIWWVPESSQLRPPGGHSRCRQRERAADGQADRERTGDRSPLGPPPIWLTPVPSPRGPAGGGGGARGSPPRGESDGFASAVIS